MTKTPPHRPQVTREPTLAVAVSPLDLPLLALDVPVGVPSFALLGTSPAGRTGGQGEQALAGPCSGRMLLACHEMRTHTASASRPAPRLFPGTGLPRAGGSRKLTVSLSEGG
jgi:hypothetical protein